MPEKWEELGQGCGCRIQGHGLVLTYCPMHKAAPEMREALEAWSKSLYPCPIDTCGCKAGHHLRRLDAEMVRQTRAALEPAPGPAGERQGG